MNKEHTVPSQLQENLLKIGLKLKLHDHNIYDILHKSVDTIYSRNFGLKESKEGYRYSNLYKYILSNIIENNN